MRTAKVLLAVAFALGLVGSASADLVARYALDGSANDSAGSNHGTEFGNPTYEAGVFNQAISLDGSGDYVNCGNASVFDITNKITVSAWVNINTVTADWMTAIAKGDSAWRLSTFVNQRRFHFAVTGGPGWDGADGSTEVPAGEWHHVCSTYDGGTIRLYLDGVLDGSKSYTGGITTNTYNVLIGENEESWGRYWDGLLDDVRIYNEALSAGDVEKLYFEGTETIYEHAGLSVYAPVSGADLTTTSSTYTNIEDTGSPPVREPRINVGCGITTERQGDLKITFSGEVYATNNKRVFLRALVDGELGSPSNVVCAAEGFTGTPTFSFTKENLGAGGHWIQMQWLVDAGGTAHFGDGTLTAYSSSDLTEHGRILAEAAPSGPWQTTTTAGWVDVPDLTGNIDLVDSSNLAITICGEAYTSAGKRMFVRALVDGQVASPLDVVYSGGFLGTRSYTFVKENVGAGSHAVRVQWLVDAGGTAYIGDRTLTVCAAPELTKHGGLSVKAAPSGPDKTTTSSAWVDIPDMSGSIASALDAKLDITFSAEADTSGGARMFVRALVDGQPANPSDIVLTSEGFPGLRSFTFMKEDLSVGPHTVKMQWRVDAGGTARMGDRTLTLNHWRSQIPDLSKPFYSMKPTIGKRNLLVILWDAHRPDDPAPLKSAVEDLIFGSKPSVRGYFLENSGGRFVMQNAGVLGWYDADKPADHYWNHPASCCADGFLSGHVEKWAEAIRKADAHFNYKAYDTNNDGVLGADELGILIVIPQNSPFGTNRGVAGRECPNWEPLIVDGVRINVIAEAYIGAPPSLGLVAHELAHLLLGAGDMYFGFFQPYAAGAYSIMDQSPHNPPHLDPFHKLRLGWLVPPIVTADGCYEIPDIETHNEVYVLNDPMRGTKEYCIVENRWRGNSYDSYLPDSGLVVWHIMEDPAVFDNLPTPPDVDPVQWNDPKWKGWARRAIRMIRPIYGPPFNSSLWDGSNPATGYDLLPVDPNPNHVSLKWSDGTPSKFAITHFPTASPLMRVFIDAGNPVECFHCMYSTYDDWVTLGKPACWCTPYQCDGDADGADSGGINKYRVFTGDLNLIVANWKKKAGDPALDPCADIDHKDSGGINRYRVFTGDLNKVVVNWTKKDTQLPGNCPRSE
jgi:M6 family metalloprotease-like protein